MAIGSAFAISKGNLVIKGKEVLTEVPQNVFLSNDEPSHSVFLGAKSSQPSSRHVFKLGQLQGYRLMCLFRFKLWWMLPHAGNCGKDIPVESQMLLLEARQNCAVDQNNGDYTSDHVFYILFLPVLEGPFRSSLQGNETNELELCVESGDPAVQTTHALQAVFVNAGENPFELITESFKALQKQKGTFVLREKKKMPGILDWFGWCTWDAFYTDVNPEGISQGLQSLAEGGTPARFLIIDDGWQETINEFKIEGEPFIEGTQFAARLADIRENKKFRKHGQEDSEELVDGLHDIVKHLKETYDLKYVYVWHALAGYWGGLLPYAPNLKKYEATLNYPVKLSGNLSSLRDIAIDSMEKYGVEIINPNKIGEFYNDLHTYLASAGIDGVKVDVQNAIETLGAGFGGRVSLTQKYQHALEDSVARNFSENACISSMSLSTDSIYSSKKIAIVRASEDFMPTNPTSHTLHIISVAFNSLLLGEVMLPDWDMFHSKHIAAECHAAARAVGGCGIYVSDRPHDHDFKVLKKLVLPDGSVLRARFPGRPTRDCLFVDPAGDKKSLLKIWNMNACTGVVGVFNCQGAGWSDELKCIEAYENPPESLTGCVRPRDVESLADVAEGEWNGDCAMYAHNTGSLTKLSTTGSLTVSLKILEYEVYTVSPITDYKSNVFFAPLGLIDMYNAGGAVQSIEYTDEDNTFSIKMTVRGCGRFGAYTSKNPISCLVNMKQVEHSYESSNCLLTLIIPNYVAPNKITSQEIEVQF